MKLRYSIHIMYSDSSVQSLMNELNSLEGITTELKTEPFMKRTLHIDMSDIDPFNNQQVTNDEVLSLGAMIATYLMARI